MSRTILDRRLPLSVYSACRQCLHSSVNVPSRTFTTTSRQAAANESPLANLARLSGQARKDEVRKAGLASIFGRDPSPGTSTNTNTRRTDEDAAALAELTGRDAQSLGPAPTHHFHIYSTKHNTHITLTNPNRDSLISLSAGNIGFRKAARGTYDAAYQLASYVIGRIQEEGLMQKIKGVEVVLRGFGIGREAVTKVLLGTEGRLLRPKIVQVSDSTRLKFGGTRSRKPRRLG